MITGDQGQFVLEMINLPSLHILIGKHLIFCNLKYYFLYIGVVNKLVSTLENDVFNSNVEGQKFVDKFFREVSIYDLIRKESM